MKTQSLILGILAGGLVTALVTTLWPKKQLRWARPLVSAGLGVLVAYLLMVYA